MRGKSRASKGYSLIEVLLSVSLLVVVCVAVMGSLVQGIKIYERLNEAGKKERFSFLMEKLTRDLKSYVKFSLFEDSFSKESISFGSLRPFYDPEGNWLDVLPCQIAYEYNPQTKEVTRTEKGYPSGTSGEKKEVLANSVEAIRFNFEVSKSEQLSEVAVSIKLKNEDPFVKKIKIPCGSLAAKRSH